LKVEEAFVVNVLAPDIKEPHCSRYHLECLEYQLVQQFVYGSWWVLSL
jgi:hypothetical protein